MRHGKAVEYAESRLDFERSLEQRGRIEVSEAAKNMHTEGIKPDLIISSPAFRTSSTARIVASVFSLDPEEIIYNAALYNGTSEVYLKVANLYPNSAILMVGHNPSIAELSIYFCGNPTRGFPTSALAAFEFENAEITLADTPKMLYMNTRK